MSDKTRAASTESLDSVASDSSESGNPPGVLRCGTLQKPHGPLGKWANRYYVLTEDCLHRFARANSDMFFGKEIAHYDLECIMNVKPKKQLIIFDRYAHDILIDPIRYNFNLSKKITKKILNYFPEPDLWIILNAGSYTAYNRKKEISLKETVRQSREYLKFAKNRKNSIVINTSKNLKKSVTILTKTIISQHGKN